MAADRKLLFGEEEPVEKPPEVQRVTSMVMDYYYDRIGSQTVSSTTEEGNFDHWDRLGFYHEDFKTGIDHLKDLAIRVAQLQGEASKEIERYLAHYDPFIEVRNTELHAFITGVLVVRTLNRISLSGPNDSEFDEVATREAVSIDSNFGAFLHGRGQSAPTLPSFIAAYLNLHSRYSGLSDAPRLIPDFPPPGTSLSPEMAEL